MKKIRLAATILCLSISAFPLKAFALSTASFSISGATYAPGASFSVPIYESSSASVTVVEADISYDPAQLKVTDTDFSNSDFSGGLKNFDNGSTLSIIRYAFNGVSGQGNIGTITFTNIGSAATTAITFASSSQIYSNGQKIWDGVITGATFNFAAPAPTPAPVSAKPQPIVTTAPPKRIAPITQAAPAAAPTTDLNSVNSASIYHTIAPPIRASNEPWEAIIVGGVLVIMALLVRLFNLHKRIKARVQNRRRQRARHSKTTIRKR